MENTQSTRNVSVIKDADNNSIVMILDLRCRYTEMMVRLKDIMFFMHQC